MPAADAAEMKMDSLKLGLALCTTRTNRIQPTHANDEPESRGMKDLTPGYRPASVKPRNIRALQCRLYITLLKKGTDTNINNLSNVLHKPISVMTIPE